jgi:hypothetical protein
VPEQEEELEIGGVEEGRVGGVAFTGFDFTDGDS